MRIVFALVVALCGASGSSAATDAEVLDTALSDFVLSTDHCKGSSVNDPVRVHDTTRQATTMTSDAQFRSELEDAQFAALAPLLDTFRKRNAAELPLVRFSWGPTAHGATATYFLERADHGWRILWKRTAIYA